MAKPSVYPSQPGIDPTIKRNLSNNWHLL